MPLSWNVLVSCSTSFLLLTDTPCHSAKWPLAVTPFGSVGVNVAVPSAVVVSQNPVPVVKDVVWNTPVCAIAVSVPGSPVHGFVMAWGEQGEVAELLGGGHRPSAARSGEGGSRRQQGEHGRQTQCSEHTSVHENLRWHIRLM